MARPREFDPDQAIADALNVFWAHGYEGASLPDLLDGMGITRGSLYKAFTDKKTLFLRVMAAYEDKAVAPAVTVLSDTATADGFARIETAFNNILLAVDHGDERGCLLCSAAAGPASDDADIAIVVHDQLRQMRDGFATALAATNHSNPDGFSDLLLSQYVGMRIMVRAKVAPSILHASRDALFDTMRQGHSV